MRTALPSNRSFGWFFTGVFAVGALLYPWALALAALTALVTFTREAWLAPLNRGWMKLGEWMGRVVNPVILGVIFFGVFTPVGAAMRLFGRDAMCRRWQPRAPSYWVKRDPPGPAEDTYRNMF